MREHDRAHAPTPTLTLRDELADFSADPRLLGLSALAVCIGAASALVAKALLVLIRVITNAAYFHALSTRESAPEGSGLGPWAAAVPVHADETVRAAVVKLLHHGARRLPVVRRGDPLTVVGYLDRADVASARLGWYRSEHAKDGGWSPWAPRAAGGADLARAGTPARGRTPG